MSMIVSLMRASDAEIRTFIDHPESFGEDLDHRSRDVTDVDKAWHAIHFLLNGDASKGKAPLNFLMHGGQEIDGDMGYGPARAFSAAEASAVATALEGVSSDELRKRYEPAALEAARIYPTIWIRDGDEGFDYVKSNYVRLCQFMRETCTQDKGFVVWCS